MWRSVVVDWDRDRDLAFNLSTTSAGSLESAKQNTSSPAWAAAQAKPWSAITMSGGATFPLSTSRRITRIPLGEWLCLSEIPSDGTAAPEMYLNENV